VVVDIARDRDPAGRPATPAARRRGPLLGAAYLIWLGASGLWRSLVHDRSAAREVEVRVGGAGRGFHAGFMTNLLNRRSACST
jgi:threonine/homoserine/homoserine lactone efflux protein